MPRRTLWPKTLSDFTLGFGIFVNMSETDLQLLARYAHWRAEDAFAEIVRRHIDLVHSAALRQVCSPELAEEVAQAVFVELARRAGQLPHDTVVGAWLYHLTRYRAIDVVRREAGRRIREQTAQELQAMNATAEDWTHIEPILDDAMHALEDTDRLAVLMRYFQNKPLREVGQALGVTDDAAQKRVCRAVERLREFFAKRGITVGASGLTLILSTNAVQAAPVGLAFTISTTASTVVGATTTLTATATKAIAMTTMQKTLIAAVLAAAIGGGIYEAHQAASARHEIDMLQERQAPLAAQIEQLTLERDEAARQLTSSRDDRDRLQGATAELLRLRAEVTRLKAESRELAQSNASNTNNQTLSEALLWKSRANQLKAYLEQSPAAKIPELQFMTEQDWLDAARPKLATEADYRRASSALRTAAEKKVLSMFQKAVKAYQDAGKGKFPADFSELQPYLDPPLDSAVLDRWQITAGSTVPSVRVGEVIITQKAPVDDVFDPRLLFGSDLGNGSTDFLPPEHWAALQPVYNAYRAAHDGQRETDPSELQPYATTPEQQAALQKMILRSSSK